MRLGVLDIGSNTVHLLLVDGRPGARPEAYADHEQEGRALASTLRGQTPAGLVCLLRPATRTIADVGPPPARGRRPPLGDVIAEMRDEDSR